MLQLAAAPNPENYHSSMQQTKTWTTQLPLPATGSRSARSAAAKSAAFRELHSLI
jgi:hypothetical protein